MSIVAKYKTYTAEDKVALKELVTETQKRLELSRSDLSTQPIKLQHMVAAVEPNEETPEFLVGM